MSAESQIFFFLCYVEFIRLLYRRVERTVVSFRQQLDFIKSSLLPFSCSELLCPGDHLLLLFLVANHLHGMDGQFHFSSK